MTWTVPRREPFLRICFHCHINDLELVGGAPPSRATATRLALSAKPRVIALQFDTRAITHYNADSDPWPRLILSYNKARLEACLSFYYF